MALSASDTKSLVSTHRLNEVVDMPVKVPDCHVIRDAVSLACHAPSLHNS